MKLDEIRKIIIQKLDEIEEKEEVKILYAVESGSRAWGFASPDSDYDVRFIYRRKKEAYLRLNPKRDVIEWQLDEVLDINGWDLNKALQQFHKSNAVLFEWGGSPIVYRTTEEWEQLYRQAGCYFAKKSCLYHYYGTAYSNFKEHLTREYVKYKKYFYVVRPLLAYRYILEQGCPPPVLFAELLKQELPAEIRQEIDRLLIMKMDMPEIGEGIRSDCLNQYIEEQLVRFKKQSEECQDDRRLEWDTLNKLFLESLDRN